MIRIKEISEEIKKGITGKAGFPLYVDYYDKFLKKLSPEQLKQVIDKLFIFVESCEFVESDDLAINIILEAIFDNIIRDEKKRLKQRKASAINGKKGGRPKNENRKTKPTTKSGEKEVEKNKDVDYFKNKEINDLFLEFLQIRKKIKAINSPIAINKLINQLNEYSDEHKKIMLNNSIINSWKGLYEPKKNSSNQNYQEPIYQPPPKKDVSKEEVNDLLTNLFKEKK